MPSDDELGAVIYTALLDRSQPWSLEDMCQGVRGLAKRQESVARLLQTMVRDDIVVHVGNEQYTLREKLTPALGQRSIHLQPDQVCDGPTPAVSHESGNPVQSSTRALVPVQQMAVQTLSSSDATCDSPSLRVHTEHLEKILDTFRQNSGPIKAKDIAQRTGMGTSKMAVNRYLYHLKEQGVLQTNGRAEWNLIKDVKGADLLFFGAQLAKLPCKSKRADPPSLGTCGCHNAGPGCVHINLQQNIQHNHYYTQVGEHNQMNAKAPERDDY